MIIFNELEINTAEELEAAIADLSDYNKDVIRAQFYETTPPTTKNVPPSITPRQARQALLMAGITEEMVVAAINSLSSPTKEMAMIEWEYSIAFLRANPLVATMASMLGWTSDQVDDLWILGESL